MRLKYVGDDVAVAVAVTVAVVGGSDGCCYCRRLLYSISLFLDLIAYRMRLKYIPVPFC